jgi:hypothetical protein
MGDRIIDLVFEKRAEIMQDEAAAIVNSRLAMAAIHGGVRSRAWRAYMLQFVRQSPLGTPIDPRQLARLLATDGTDGNPDLDRHRAYLVANATCGPTTPDFLHVEVNTIDEGIDETVVCMTDAELQAAIAGSGGMRQQ